MKAANPFSTNVTQTLAKEKLIQRLSVSTPIAMPNATVMETEKSTIKTATMPAPHLMPLALPRLVSF